MKVLYTLISGTKKKVNEVANKKRSSTAANVLDFEVGNKPPAQPEGGNVDENENEKICPASSQRKTLFLCLCLSLDMLGIL